MKILNISRAEELIRQLRIINDNLQMVSAADKIIFDGPYGEYESIMLPDAVRKEVEDVATQLCLDELENQKRRVLKQIEEL